MRGLKFRAFDKVTKRYYAVSGLELDGNGELCEVYLAGIEIDESNPTANVRKPSDVVLEQGTGLKDKNGKEISEGDIVEYTTCYYGKEKRHRKVVEWQEWDSDDFGVPHNLGYFNLNKHMEVIGKIHENPELLEAKNVY